MSLRRNIIVLLAVLVVAQAQMIPRPIIDPVEIRNTTGTVVFGSITVQHLPGTERIVVAWPEVGPLANTANIMGAIISTAGAILTPPFEISPVEPSEFGISLPTVIARADGNFSVLYSVNTTAGNRLRDFNPEGIALTDPLVIASSKCSFTTAAEHKSTGNIVIGCSNGTQFSVSLVDRAGKILNETTYATPSSQSIAMLDVNISGDYVAVAVVMVATSVPVGRVWIGRATSELNLVDFDPFSGVLAITYRSSIVPDPLNPDYFYLLSISNIVPAGPTGLNAVQNTRFNASGVLSGNYVAFETGRGLSAAISNSGSGILFMSAGVSSFVYKSFPIEFTNSTFAINGTDVDVVHNVTTADASNYAPYDTRHSATAWDIGSAVVWPEVVNTTSSRVMIQIYGSFCGDNVTQGNEQCDGGVDCNANCTCPDGFITSGSGCTLAPLAPQAPITPQMQPTPDSPPQTNDQPVQGPTSVVVPAAGTPRGKISSASIMQLAYAGFVLAAIF